MSSQFVVLRGLRLIQKCVCLAEPVGTHQITCWPPSIPKQPKKRHVSSSQIGEGQPLKHTLNAVDLQSLLFQVIIKFTSDGSVSANGFKLVYETYFEGAKRNHNNPCAELGILIQDRAGYIMTPGYDENRDYNNNMMCQWMIITSPGQVVRPWISGVFEHHIARLQWSMLVPRGSSFGSRAWMWRLGVTAPTTRWWWWTTAPWTAPCATAATRPPGRWRPPATS